MTIASSGQGRWQEELEFPVDARHSKYTPVLIVLDATPNPKLEQLEAAFRDARGEVYKGSEAWAHLDTVAGPTMAQFLEKYVREPMQSLLAAVPQRLPEFNARTDQDEIIFSIGGETFRIHRKLADLVDEDEEVLPEDLNEGIPGP